MRVVEVRIQVAADMDSESDVVMLLAAFRSLAAAKDVQCRACCAAALSTVLRAATPRRCASHPFVFVLRRNLGFPNAILHNKWQNFLMGGLHLSGNKSRTAVIAKHMHACLKSMRLGVSAKDMQLKRFTVGAGTRRIYTER